LQAHQLIKEVTSAHITHLVDKEIAEINQQLQLEGKPELSGNEVVFEKVKAIENYTEDDEGENSKRYQLLPKFFLDRMQGLAGEVDKSGDYDPLRVKESITKLLDDNHIRTRGWNTAVNSITAILDTSRMGYQYIHNFKHARHLILREYEETDLALLPDERYEIGLKYYDAKQIREEKAAYSAQLNEFQREVMRLWNVVEQVYLEEKAKMGKRDWNDVMASTLERDKGGRKQGGWFQTAPEGGSAAQAPKRPWNEVAFIPRSMTKLEEMNQTYEHTVGEFKQRFLIVRQRLDEIFELRFPDHRLIVEQRLNFLESQFLEFMSQVNPYHIQPGLMLELSITSIKRLRATVKGMSNVLNEFLSGISKGFVDRALAHRGRRRSNVSDGIGSFEQAEA
jgi:hypothetical protein